MTDTTQEQGKMLTQEELFASLVQTMVQENGWPEDAAREVCDLAQHAAAQAFETFERVSFSAGNPMVMLQTAALGLKLLAERADHALEKTKMLAEALMADPHVIDTEEGAEALLARLTGARG
jgi:hypothetical protein